MILKYFKSQLVVSLYINTIITIKIKKKKFVRTIDKNKKFLISNIQVTTK